MSALSASDSAEVDDAAHAALQGCVQVIRLVEGTDDYGLGEIEEDAAEVAVLEVRVSVGIRQVGDGVLHAGLGDLVHLFQRQDDTPRARSH